MLHDECDHVAQCTKAQPQRKNKIALYDMEFPPAAKMTKAVKGFAMPEVRTIVVYGNEEFVCGVCGKDNDEENENEGIVLSFSQTTMQEHQATCLHFLMCMRNCEYDEAKLMIMSTLNNSMNDY